MEDIIVLVNGETYNCSSLINVDGYFDNYLYDSNTIDFNKIDNINVKLKLLDRIINTITMLLDGQKSNINWQVVNIKIDMIRINIKKNDFISANKILDLIAQDMIIEYAMIRNEERGLNH